MWPDPNVKPAKIYEFLVDMAFCKLMFNIHLQTATVDQEISIISLLCGVLQEHLVQGRRVAGGA